MGESNGRRHLSHSQITTMLKCPKQYEFKYIKKLQRPVGPALIRGSAYHSAIEANFRHKLRTGMDLDIEIVLQAYDTAWNKKLAETEIDWQGESPGEVKDVGATLLTGYLGSYAALIVPAEIEKVFEIELPGLPYTLKGVIDLITNTGIVVDHKTAGKSWGENDAHTDLQPHAYAAAILTDPTIEVMNFEFHVAVPLKSGPKVQILGTTRNRSHVEWYRQLCCDIVRLIESGIYPPNPTGWWCGPKWCPFYDICGSKGAHHCGD